MPLLLTVQAALDRMKVSEYLRQIQIETVPCTIGYIKLGATSIAPSYCGFNYIINFENEP